ncbi:MAG: phosphatase PAP2 family protein [Actinomycetota bacterium]
MRRAILFMLTCSIAATTFGVARADECAADPAYAALVTSKAVTFTDEPDAGTWRPWFVHPGDVPVPPPPSLASTEAVADALAVASAIHTNHFTVERDAEPAGTAWNRTLLDMITKYSAKPDRDPPRIARQIAIFETAMEDALISAWHYKYCYLRPPPSSFDPLLIANRSQPATPSYPSDQATADGVGSVLLSSFFPEEGSTFDDVAAGNGEDLIARGVSYPSDVAAGYRLGREVALKVLAARANDGSAAQWDGSGRITGTCNWSPTPPSFKYPPLEPVWGKVSPFVLPSSDAVRPVAPPACDGPDYISAAQDLYQASLHLTDRQRAIALYWAGGGGTETPPGMSLHIALDTAHAHGLDTMRQARVLAYVGTALADAGIAAWDTKFTYWADRPITTIRRLWDPSWSPLISTPPFPGYISGHATFTNAAMTVLSEFFPDQATQFHADATEAAMSRYYGGIHVRYDNEVGLSVGERVGDYAVMRSITDGAGPPMTM